MHTFFLLFCYLRMAVVVVVFDPSHLGTWLFVAFFKIFFQKGCVFFFVFFVFVCTTVSLLFLFSLVFSKSKNKNKTEKWDVR